MFKKVKKKMMKLFSLILLLVSSNTYAELKIEERDFSVPKVVMDYLENNMPKNLGDFEKAVYVNNFVNRYSYYQDSNTYFKKDYWATPKEFVNLGGGDCEDFSIMKKKILENYGISSNYVIFKKRNQAHVSLIYKNGDKSYLLDNEWKWSRYVKEVEMSRIRVFFIDNYSPIDNVFDVDFKNSVLLSNFKG